jgi:hypothetical protein
VNAVGVDAVRITEVRGSPFSEMRILIRPSTQSSWETYRPTLLKANSLRELG